MTRLHGRIHPAAVSALLGAAVIAGFAVAPNDCPLTAISVACAAAAIAGYFLVLALERKHEEHKRDLEGEMTLLHSALRQAAEAVVITDARGDIVFVNPAFERVTGYTREQVIGKNPRILKSGRQSPEFYTALWRELIAGRTWLGRLVNMRKDGSVYEEEASIAPVRDEKGVTTHYIALKRDLSVERALEEQLWHSQKMDAIGRLAGGVAHDFNNILTSIIGYSEMIAGSVPPGSSVADDALQIQDAGRRAAALTRQLLTFSRKQIVSPVPMDLGAAVTSIEKMLRRTIGEDVKLILDVGDEDLWINADPSQVDQVLMNLAVNSRDAMPKGGMLSITVAAQTLETPVVRALTTLPAGDYAVLAIRDNGTGMDASVLGHIFEPFFTTKEKGKGTGLGLATVFGVVQQAGGHILVDSAPGQGSLFSIYFPRVAPGTGAPVASSKPQNSSRGTETVLVVEDDNVVMRLVCRTLAAAGYETLACEDAEEALSLAAARSGQIHLLLTDVIMPGMGGRELTDALAKGRPGLKVLYMSGYSDERLSRHGLVDEGIELLQKPFTGTALAAHVRKILDRRS